MKTEELLEELGFGKGRIVETILTTRARDGSMSAAPMGVTRTGPDILEVKPFKSSATYRNLMGDPEACANITSDPETFLVTAFKGEELHGFKRPLINSDMSLDSADAAVFIEGLKEHESAGDRGCLEGRVRRVEVKRRLPSAFSRGRAEAIEAIVHATRMKEFFRTRRAEDAEELYNRFNECKKVVERVSAPGSPETRVMEALETLINRWRRGASR